MTSLTEIKARFDGMSIEAIEIMATARQEASTAARREFVEALYYLRNTKRFRESKAFEDASFGEYLRAKFMMTEDQFDRERVAYIHFADESARFGAGMVAKAIRKCGTIGAGKVFKSIGQRRAPTIKAVEKAIEREAAAIQPPAAKATPPAGEALRDEKAADTMRELLLAKQRTIDEQSQQIEKLKRTVVQLKAQLAEKERELRRYRQPVAGMDALCGKGALAPQPTA